MNRLRSPLAGLDLDAASTLHAVVMSKKAPALLKAVVNPEESVALWVADPNPRAQAFYRKHGFVADGAAQAEGGMREIRMVRGRQHRR